MDPLYNSTGIPLHSSFDCESPPGVFDDPTNNNTHNNSTKDPNSRRRSSMRAGSFDSSPSGRSTASGQSWGEGRSQITFEFEGGSNPSIRGSFRSQRQQSRRQSTVSIQQDNTSAFPGSTPQSPSTLAAQQQQQRREFDDDEYLFDQSEQQIPEVHVSARDIAQFKASIPLLRRYLLQRAKDHPKGHQSRPTQQHLTAVASSSPKKAIMAAAAAASPSNKKANHTAPSSLTTRGNRATKNSSGIVSDSAQLLDAYVHERETDVLRELHPPEGQEVDLIITHSRPVEYPLSSDDEGGNPNQHNLSINTTSTAIAAASPSPAAYKPSPSISRHVVPALNSIIDGHHNRSVLSATAAGAGGGEGGGGGGVVVGGEVMEVGPSLWAEDTLLWLLDDTNPTAVSIVKLALAEQEELRQTSLVMESFLGTEGVCAVAAAHGNYWEEVHHEYRRYISGATPNSTTTTTATEKHTPSGEGSGGSGGLGSTERYLLKPEEALEVLLLSVGSKEVIAPQTTTDVTQGPRIRNHTYPSSQPPTANYDANREDLSGGMDISPRQIQQQQHVSSSGDDRPGGPVVRGVGEDCSSITRPMLNAISEPTYALHSCTACARMASGGGLSSPSASLGNHDPSANKLADELHDQNCIHSSYKNYGRVAAERLREELFLRSEQGGGGGGINANNGTGGTSVATSNFGERSGVGLGGTLGLRSAGEGLEAKASTSTKLLQSRSVLGGAAAPQPKTPPIINQASSSDNQQQSFTDRSRQESQLLHLGALHRLLRVDAYFATHPPSKTSKSQHGTNNTRKRDENGDIVVDGVAQSSAKDPLGSTLDAMYPPSTHTPHRLDRYEYSDLSSDDVQEALHGKDQAAIDVAKRGRRRSRQRKSIIDSSATQPKGADTSTRGAAGGSAASVKGGASMPTFSSSKFNFSVSTAAGGGNVDPKNNTLAAMESKGIDVRIVHNNTAFGLDHRSVGRALNALTHDAVSNKGGMVALSVAAQVAASNEDRRKSKQAKRLHDTLHSAPTNTVDNYYTNATDFMLPKVVGNTAGTTTNHHPTTTTSKKNRILSTTGLTSVQVATAMEDVSFSAWSTSALNPPLPDEGGGGDNNDTNTGNIGRSLRMSRAGGDGGGDAAGAVVGLSPIIKTTPSPFSFHHPNQSIHRKRSDASPLIDARRIVSMLPDNNKNYGTTTNGNDEDEDGSSSEDDGDDHNGGGGEGGSLFVHDSTFGHRGQRPTLLNRHLLPTDSKKQQQPIVIGGANGGAVGAGTTAEEERRSQRLDLAKERARKMRELELDAKSTNFKHAKAVLPSLGKVFASVLAPPLPPKLYQQPSTTTTVAPTAATRAPSVTPLGVSSSNKNNASSNNPLSGPNWMNGNGGSSSAGAFGGSSIPSLDSSPIPKGAQIVSPLRSPHHPPSHHPLSPHSQSTHHQRLLDESRRNLVSEHHHKITESGIGGGGEGGPVRQFKDAQRTLFTASPVSSPRSPGSGTLTSPVGFAIAPSTSLLPSGNNNNPFSNASFSSAAASPNKQHMVVGGRKEDNPHMLSRSLSSSSSNSEVDVLEAESNRQAVGIVSAAAYHSLSVQSLLKPLFKDQQRRAYRKAREEKRARRGEAQQRKMMHQFSQGGGGGGGGGEYTFRSMGDESSFISGYGDTNTPTHSTYATSQQMLASGTSSGVGGGVSDGGGKLTVQQPLQRPPILLEKLAKLVPPSLPLSTLHTQLQSVLGPTNEDLVRTMATYLCRGIDNETGPMVTLGPGTVPVTDDADPTTTTTPQQHSHNRASEIERTLIARCREMRHGSYSGSVSHTLRALVSRIQHAASDELHRSPTAPITTTNDGGAVAVVSQQQQRPQSSESMSESVQAFITAAAEIHEDVLELDDDDPDPEDGDEKLLLEGLIAKHRTIGSSALMSRGGAAGDDDTGGGGDEEDGNALRFRDVAGPLLFSNKPTAQTLVEYDNQFEMKGANPWLHAPPAPHQQLVITHPLVVPANTSPSDTPLEVSRVATTNPSDGSTTTSTSAPHIPPHIARRNKLIASLKSTPSATSTKPSPAITTKSPPSTRPNVPSPATTSPSNNIIMADTDATTTSSSGGSGNLLDVSKWYDDTGLATHALVSKRMDQRAAMANAHLPTVDYLTPHTVVAAASTGGVTTNNKSNPVYKSPNFAKHEGGSSSVTVASQSINNNNNSPLPPHASSSVSPYQHFSGSLSPLVPIVYDFPVSEMMMMLPPPSSASTETTLGSAYRSDGEVVGRGAMAAMQMHTQQHTSPAAKVMSTDQRHEMEKNTRTLLERTLAGGIQRTRARSHYWVDLRNLEDAESKERLKILYACQQEAAMKTRVLDADFQANVGWKTHYDPSRKRDQSRATAYRK